MATRMPRARKAAMAGRGLFFNGVGHRDNACRGAVDGDQHRGTAGFGESAHLCGEGGDVDVGVVEEALVADQDLAALHEGPDALAGDGVELCGVDKVEAAVSGTGDDGLGQGVL